MIIGKYQTFALFTKKGDKQIINNYRPVPLLPICGKIFERLIFNSLYQFLEDHNLLSIHQSGFRCNNSCINQLLFIVHTLYKTFDAYPTLDARGVFWICPRILTKFGTKG